MAGDLDLPGIRAATDLDGMGDNLRPFQGWVLVGLCAALRHKFFVYGTIIRTYVVPKRRLL